MLGYEDRLLFRDLRRDGTRGGLQPGRRMGGSRCGGHGELGEEGAEGGEGQGLELGVPLLRLPIARL